MANCLSLTLEHTEASILHHALMAYEPTSACDENHTQHVLSRLRELLRKKPMRNDPYAHPVGLRDAAIRWCILVGLECADDWSVNPELVRADREEFPELVGTPVKGFVEWDEDEVVKFLVALTRRGFDECVEYVRRDNFPGELPSDDPDTLVIGN